MPKPAAKIVTLALGHINEKYILGAIAPKNNANWTGPWDCAEFASWCVYQVGGFLYGCNNNSGNPASADAYTGYWARDAKAMGQIVSVETAAATPGAFLLRLAQPGLIGHIVISDGAGGTVEAAGAKKGVIAGKLQGRRWDLGIFVPNLDYPSSNVTIAVPQPNNIIRVTDPLSTGSAIRKIQKALKDLGYSPGKIDGVYGAMTAAAVSAFQLAKGLIPDGEVGPVTSKLLKIS
ncbi:peptidoglycan-binding domain-containing protein [Nevskia ramosa]|uniref:peptidoglycan-binding domain-containing protein n=1 Tax=Nevskia ramosa TaxID=64002 RepID=UPI003D0B6894